MILFKERYPLSYYLLLLYSFLLPIEDFFLQGIFGSASRIAGGLVIAVYFIYEKNETNLKLVHKGYYLFTLWAIMSVIAWSQYPDYYSIIRLILWLLITIIVANMIYWRPSFTPYIFTAFTLSSIYLVYVSLYQFLQGASIDELDRVNIEEIDQNLLAMSFLVSIAFLLFVIFHQSLSFMMRSIILLGILLFFGGVISTGSRSSIITLILFTLYIIPKKDIIKSSNIILFVTFTVFILLIFETDNPFQRFLNYRINLAFEDKGANRLIIWSVAPEMIKDNLITGVGFRNFPYRFKDYLDLTPLDVLDYEKMGGREFVGSHNTVIEVISELGIVGFILYYWFQITMVIKLIKVQKVLNYSILLIALLVGLNVNGLFIQITNLKVFWLLIGIASGLKLMNNKSAYELPAL